jgi:hypothetical protein
MKESDAFNRASFDRALSAAGLEPLELPRRLFDGLPSTTSPVTALYEPFRADGHLYIALEQRADFGWDQQAPSPASGPLPRAETELVAIARDRQGKVWLVQRLPKYHCSRSHPAGCLALSGAQPRPYWVAFELPQGADLAGRRTIEYDASLVSQQYVGGASCAGPAPP